MSVNLVKLNVNITVIILPVTSPAAVELDTPETPSTTPSVTVITHLYPVVKVYNRGPRNALCFGGPIFREGGF